MKNPGITLNFTEVAEPVTISVVKDWVDRVDAAGLDVSRIALWEHQLDWLVKAAGGPDECADQLVTGARIWSIPLTIRKSVFGLIVETQS